MSTALRLLALTVLWLDSGCMTLSVTAAPTEPPPPPVPDKFQGDEPPPLVDTGVEGCQAAPAVDPNLFFCAKEEHWYRFALNRWFLAFAWNGNWFPVTASELPKSLAKVTPKAEQVKKTREEKLEDLEKRLEELEKQEQEAQDAAPGDAAPESHEQKSP
jgi:hypothetical protein